MQLTFSPKYGWDNRGIGSRLEIPPCSLENNNYKNCYGEPDPTNYGKREYILNANYNQTFKYYTNTLQGISANVKDGLRVLQEKYRQKCPKENLIIGGLEFSCLDIEKILVVWGYNGFAKNKETGEYKGDYLKYIAGKLASLSNYFTGMTYNNADKLIEKLEMANENKKTIKLYSPGILYVIDSEGRVTGLVNSAVKEEIPNSMYDLDERGIAIFFPNSSYRYNVVGTDYGAYGLSVDSTENGIFTIFNATDIPISPQEIHQYAIDWDILSQGGKGITLQVDSEGDGIFEKTVITDRDLTSDEFILQTETNVDIDADTLNLKSKGRWITAYIELPVGYDVAKIDVATIRLNGAVAAIADPQYGFVTDPAQYLLDHDGDGILERMVKFDRSGVQALLSGAVENAPLTVGGYVSFNSGGADFRGNDFIRVIDMGNMHESSDPASVAK